MKPADVADLVSSTVTLARASVTRQGMTILLLSEHDVGADRTATYLGASAVVLAAMVAAGHEAEGDACGQAEASLAQVPAPPGAKIGRKAPGESWSAAMAAIDLEDPDWYGVCIAARDDSSIADLSAWVHVAGFGLFVAQTKSTDVLDGLDGNLLLDLQAAPADKRTALLWHDPEVASGADFPEMISSAGPWDVRPIEGVARTLVVGSQADDEQEVTFPGTRAQRAGVGVSSPYSAFTDGWILSIRIDEDLGGVGLGGEEVQIEITPGAFADLAAPTSAEVLALVSAALGAQATVTVPGDLLTVRSTTYGTASSVRFGAATTAGLATALGITVGITNGTGVGADLAELTPAELVTAAAGTTGMGWTALSDDTVRMRGTVKGRWGYVRVAGGSANQSIGFARSKVSGAGALEDYADAALLGSALTADLDLAQTGQITWNGLTLAGISPDKIRRDKSLALRAAYCNTYELRSNAQPDGELHDGRLTCGTFVDNLTTADWMALRVAEDILLDIARKNLSKTKYLFTDASMGAAMSRVVGARILLAGQSGHFDRPDVKDFAPGKDTGLHVPTLDEVPQALRDVRRWGPIRYRQQIAGAGHGAVAEGILFER